MARKFASEVRAMSSEELNKELLGLREEQFKLRMQRSTGQLANPARFNAVRKEIARIKTVLMEKKSAVTEPTAS
jgi:large subunit ribosomal protein L29